MARIPGLYRRGNVWWCKYYVNGRPVRESAGTEKETEAKRFLDGRRGRVATGAPILPRADRVRYARHVFGAKFLDWRGVVKMPIRG